MCGQGSLFTLPNLLGFCLKVPSALYFLYHSLESLLIVICFVADLFATKKEKRKWVEAFHWVVRQWTAPPGSTQSARKWRATYQARAQYTHKLFSNEIRQKWNLIQQISQLTFSLHSLLILCYLRGSLSPPWQSRSIHYVLPLFNLVGKFNFQMNTVPF